MVLEFKTHKAKRSSLIVRTKPDETCLRRRADSARAAWVTHFSAVSAASYHVLHES